MSLVKQRHIGLAIAATLAIWLPLQLSDPEAETPPIAGIEPVRAIRATEPPEPRAGIARAPFLDPGSLQYAGEPGAAIDGATGAAPLPPLPPTPQLVGTAMGPRGKAVALVRSAAGTVETVARGETIDGWTLTLIASGEAHFTQRGETHVSALAMPNAPVSTALASSSQDLPR